MNARSGSDLSRPLPLNLRGAEFSSAYREGAVLSSSVDWPDHRGLGGWAVTRPGILSPGPWGGGSCCQGRGNTGSLLHDPFLPSSVVQ